MDYNRDKIIEKLKVFTFCVGGLGILPERL